MNDFLEGVKQGAKESPRSFIAPLVAMWLGFKWLMEFIDSYGKGQHHH